MRMRRRLPALKSPTLRGSIRRTFTAAGPSPGGKAPTLFLFLSLFLVCSERKSERKRKRVIVSRHAFLDVRFPFYGFAPLC